MMIDMEKKVLITGGSGTVGKRLGSLLLSRRHRVAHLSHSKQERANTNIETFHWDIDNKIIDEHCLNDVDTIVHLAGAGIADSRWTDARKEVLINSRTASIRLLYSLMKEKPNQVKSIISASASGYYSDRGNEPMKEEDPPHTDFLGRCCTLWEKAVDEGNDLGLRVVKFRTGVILDEDTGALPKISAPVKYGIGSPLGSGKQWISWIHLDDVAHMYLRGILDESLYGVYNMSSPHPVTNEELIKKLAAIFKKPLWLPHVPVFVLKMALGERSAVVLGSTKMEVNKIENTGFKFKFPDLKEALKDIYG